jgi:hypothetical protein
MRNKKQAIVSDEKDTTTEPPSEPVVLIGVLLGKPSIHRGAVLQEISK